MTDITIRADAPIHAKNVDEYVERMRQFAHAELVERLTKARAQVQAALATMTRNATMLDEENVTVLEGLAWAEYNLGVLAEGAEEGDIMDVSDDEEALRELWAMCYAPKGEN